MHSIAALLVTAALVVCTAPAQQAPLTKERFVPQPTLLSSQEGAFALANDTVIYVAHRSLAEHAKAFQDELLLLTGKRLKVSTEAVADGATAIELHLSKQDPDAGELSSAQVEAYSLLISTRSIIARANTLVGISWATSTLLQALDVNQDTASIPCGAIGDAPLSPYRALMIDVARSPHSVDVLRGVVRLARLYKIRYVQLHLTDDQHFTFPFAPVTDKLKNNAVTDRAELAALVKYADARGITLIPEIDLPGHSSRLVQSGYLEGAKGHADVASEKHWPKLRALLDDVISFFPSSPYFHIGGDESGAGRELVPFLERVSKHVRSRGKRLIVWEGFHGAPTKQLPATGDDRILVAAWESSYNAPWDLLRNGYELINASWRPLYVVGGDSRIHPGSTAGRKWSPEALCDWHKDRFMHWEPGRAVFEDRGPEDTNLDDGIWDVPKEEWCEKVLGGQVSVWEQRESSLLRDLRRRMPVVAERLWSGSDTKASDLLQRVGNVDQRVWGVVQPIEAVFGNTLPGPINHVAHLYSGDKVQITLRNRTRAKGEVRWATSKLGGNWDWIDFRNPADPIDPKSNAGNQVSITGSAALRVGLFAEDGTQIGAQTWVRCVNWPMRVSVTDYAIGRRVPKPGKGIGGGRIPKFDTFGADRITARYQMPMLRGPLDHAGVKGQRFEATLVAPSTGDMEIAMKTQSGHATLWLDANQDGKFAESERIIGETPNTEERLRAPVTLQAGQEYALRIDHVAALPRPVVIVTLDKPGAERPQGITKFLKTL